MRIAVVGAGYVGCVTAACMSRNGHTVVAVDTDSSKVDSLRRGVCPVVEPGLQELVARNVQEGRLQAMASSVDAFMDVDASIICVSTPSMPDGSVDVRPMMRVFAVLVEAAQKAGQSQLVIVRSTIAPGVLRRILERYSPAQLNVVANPEFLRETAAIHDFDNPPFLIFGSDRPESARAAAEIFESVPGPRHFVSLECALLVKYVSNAFHGMKIAFANEVAALCEVAGAHPLDVMNIFCEDRSLNISRAYLRPGFAFGGSCLPKDIRALVSLGQANGIHLPLLEGVLTANRLRMLGAATAIMRARPKQTTLLGLSFKKGSDDLRESPYLLLAEKLVAEGLTLRIFDPDVLPDGLVGKNREYVEQHLPGVNELLMDGLETALHGSDTVVVCKAVAPRDQLLRAIDRRRVFDLEFVLDGATSRRDAD